MNQSFSLFNSHLDLAHHYWKQIIREGDWVIDATCGNGHDSLILATLLKKGGLIALDIQEEALESTRKRLLLNNSPIHLFQQSHAQFPSLAYENPIRLIVYNLGYLPGGDKRITTQTETTKASIQAALKLLEPGGVLSITCYPGHEEGAKEQEALLSELSQLKSFDWNVCYHTFPHKRLSPNLFLIQKSCNPPSQ